MPEAGSPARISSRNEPIASARFSPLTESPPVARSISALRTNTRFNACGFSVSEADPPPPPPHPPAMISIAAMRTRSAETFHVRTAIKPQVFLSLRRAAGACGAYLILTV